MAAPGSLALLKDAGVRHHATSTLLGKLSTGASARTFGFASLNYPRWTSSPWVAATQLFKQTDVLSGYGGGRNPQNWPDPDAWWIWSRVLGGGSPPMPVGVSYFRKQITVTTPGDYSMFITADDGFELWVNGVKVAEQTGAFVWQRFTRWDHFLDAGTYDVAIRGENITRPNPAFNAAAVIFTMYSTKVGGQELDTNIARSDASWQALDYPASPPGCTPGEILGVLIDEPQTRGALWAVHGRDFTNTLDSLGNAWTGEVDLLVDVGRPVLDVARDSYTAVSSGSGTANNGTNPIVEAFLDAGSAASSAGAATLAAGVFDRHALDKTVCTVRVLPSSGKQPWTNFWPGKTVTLPAIGGGTAGAIVQHIDMSDRGVDEDGAVGGTQEISMELLQ